MANKDRAKYWWRWGIEHNEPPCGYGSTFENTRLVSAFLERIIRERRITSINDAGCGDYSFWMAKVDRGGAHYVGYDINDELVDKNVASFPGVDFAEADITEVVLMPADLVICRDCLFHLPTDRALKAVANFRESGSSYLMATTFGSLLVNLELDNCVDGPELGYGYRNLNMSIRPFDLGAPLELVDEPQFKREVGLWRIND